LVVFSSGNVYKRGMAEKKRILLVDDDMELVEMMARRLEIAGYEVIKASDGTGAAVELDYHSPDLVVSDWQMPYGRDSSLLEYMLSKEETRKIPVIIMTGFEHPYLETEAKSLGANAVLRKPVDGKVLVKEIEKLLNLKA